MLGDACLPHMSLAMIRFVCISVSLFACALCAGAARAQVSDADLVTRIGRLEATIRELTGNVEQLQYRNQQLEQQVQRLQEGPPRKAGADALVGAAAAAPGRTISDACSSASAGGRGRAAGGGPTMAEPAGGRRGDAFDPAANPNAPGAPRPLGSSTAATEPPPPVSDAPAPRQIGAPLDLSTPGTCAPPGALPPPPPANPSATGAMQATLPPTNSPRDAYDLAYGYVLHKDYSLAADSFRTFLRQYPSDRLAPEAQYWLGESLFQQQQYRDAAEAFLAVSTNMIRPRGRPKRCCGSVSRSRHWAKRRQLAPRSAKCCGNIRALR